MQTDHLPVVDCPATPRARGLAHGETLRQSIADKIERWHHAVDVAYGARPGPFLKRFLDETCFREAIRRHTPNLLDEAEGIAEGAGVDADTIYAMQLMDEEWWYGNAPGDGHCSSLAIASKGGRPTFVGQTMDLPYWHDGAQALLRTEEEDGSETLVFTSAGMVGLLGVSGKGLGLCVNTLAQLSVSRSGLPVAFAVRGALAQGTRAAAAAFLRRARHASGQTYQLGDASGVMTLECSANKSVAVGLAGGRSLHTNHPLASDDARRPGVSLVGSDDSRARLQSLVLDLGRSDHPCIDLGRVKTALSACRFEGAVSIEPSPPSPPTQSTTFGAAIFELGDTVRTWICAGPPSACDWRGFTVRPA